MKPRIRPVVPAALLAGATLTAACGGMPEHSDPRPLVGCHYFVQDDVARDLQLPWGVRLLDRPLDGWPALQQRPGVRRATTLTGREEVDFPFGYWVLTADDSLEIGYPAGGGLLLELAIINGTFSGMAQPLGDAVPPPGTLPATRPHPVRMTWARCPEDP
jgi:hypothetical protein